MDQTEAFRLVFDDSGSLGEGSWPERQVALAWLREQTKLHDAWLTGLSYSDHAPAEVLCRLLNRGPDSTSRRDRFWLTDRKLPKQVYKSAARHPGRDIHRSIAENPHFPVDLLPRLAEGNDAERATVLLVLLISEVPAEVLAQLATATDERIRRRVGGLNALPPTSRMSLLDDPDSSVRAAALPKVWAELTEKEQASWATDADPAMVGATARPPVRGRLRHCLLVLVFGSPMYVSWATANTDANTAGGWFMSLLAWPAWRFDAGDSVQNLVADDLRAILLVLLSFVFMLVFAGGIATRAQFLAGWGSYIFAGAVAALLTAFMLSQPTLLAAFQAAGADAIYGLFVGWIVGFASLGGYRGTTATTTVKEV